MIGRRGLLAATAGLAAPWGVARADAPPAVAPAPPRGAMTIAYRDDIATLDPAIGYDLVNWSLIRSLYDGLVSYRPGTTTRTLALASSHEESADGLTHVFRLRTGVRFHDGSALTSDDVAFSLARVRDPRTASPGAGFLSIIARVDTPDPGTVAITLKRPSAAFLDIMALNFAFVLPRDAVGRRGIDPGRHPIGTGPFRFDEWQPGVLLRLVANGDYFEPGVPGLERLDVRIGTEPVTAVLAFERGEIDALGDQIPPSQYVSIMSDPTLSRDVATGPRLSTVFLAMRTDRPPFADLRVRQAVAHAIDRPHLVRLMNGRITPASGILPPGMPAYDAAGTGALFDPVRSRALLREAGHTTPLRCTLLAAATDPYPRIAEALQQYLDVVGIAAEIDTLAMANVAELASDPDGPDLVFSGGLAWSADYPDPSDFYTPVLSCPAARPGGWNWPRFCDPSLDGRAAAADANPDAASRLAAWRDIFAAIEQRMPWVPLYHERLATLVSPALVAPCRAVFADPISTPINFPHVRRA